MAQVPGRHEPSAEGELNYHYILQETSRLGYNGWIGCEYIPTPTGELHPLRPSDAAGMAVTVLCYSRVGGRHPEVDGEPQTLGLPALRQQA